MTQKEGIFEYIFCGNGLSTGLILLELQQQGMLAGKKILILDTEEKSTNDKTWCYWTKQDDGLQDIALKVWHKLEFRAEKISRKISFAPYRYVKIRSEDFYHNIKKVCDACPDIAVRYERVTNIIDKGNFAEVTTEHSVYNGKKIFSSVAGSLEYPHSEKYPLVLQHFVGWNILTRKPVFDSETALFMDFSVAQKSNTRFMYVLPQSPYEALVEYTLFSPALLERDEYETEIKNYLKSHGIADYEITEKEYGVIPMTVYPFQQRNSCNVLYTGTAGGWTKPSTGYTLRRGQKLAAKTVKLLKSQGDLSKLHFPEKFSFYDSLLIDILYRDNELGKEIFTALFSRGSAHPVFAFLDEETSLSQDMNVILRCPKLPFLKALYRTLVKN